MKVEEEKKLALAAQAGDENAATTLYLRTITWAAPQFGRRVGLDGRTISDWMDAQLRKRTGNGGEPDAPADAGATKRTVLGLTALQERASKDPDSLFDQDSEGEQTVTSRIKSVHVDVMGCISTAFVKALKRYDPEKGSWTAWFKLKLNDEWSKFWADEEKAAAAKPRSAAEKDGEAEDGETEAGGLIVFEGYDFRTDRRMGRASTRLSNEDLFDHAAFTEIASERRTAEGKAAATTLRAFDREGYIAYIFARVLRAPGCDRKLRDDLSTWFEHRVLDRSYRQIIGRTGGGNVEGLRQRVKRAERFILGVPEAHALVEMYGIRKSMREESDPTRRRRSRPVTAQPKLPSRWPTRVRPGGAAQPAENAAGA
jgi:hypothetical protein